MENNYSSLQFQIQNLQHELEYLRKSKAVEVTRREHIENKLLQIQQDLALSNAEQERLKHRLTLTECRAQKLEDDLRNALQLNWKIRANNSSITENVVPEHADDEEEIKILDIKPTPFRDNQNALTRLPSIILDTSSRTVAGVLTLCGTDSQPLEDTLPPISSYEKNCGVSTFIQPENSRRDDMITSDGDLKTNQNLTGGRHPATTDSSSSACRFCGKQVPNMKKHIQRRHNARSGSKRVFICLHCSKRCMSSQSLRLHYKVAHCFIRFGCKVCSKEYLDPRSARRHSRKIYGYTEQPYEIVRETY